MKAVVVAAMGVVLGAGCFAPDVDVDTSGLRPALAHVSTGGPSEPSSAGALDSRVEDLEDDVSKLEKKLDDLKDDLKKLESRLKKLEKRLD